MSRVKDFDRWLRRFYGITTAQVVASVPGGGGITLETPTGDVDGMNNEFVFVGTPMAVFRNGVMYAPDEFSVTGTTATLGVAPASGVITGLTH
jgi:hypothetical protein